MTELPAKRPTSSMRVNVPMSKLMILFHSGLSPFLSAPNTYMSTHQTNKWEMREKAYKFSHALWRFERTEIKNNNIDNGSDTVVSWAETQAFFSLHFVPQYFSAKLDRPN